MHSVELHQDVVLRIDLPELRKKSEFVNDNQSWKQHYFNSAFFNKHFSYRWIKPAQKKIKGLPVSQNEFFGKKSLNLSANLLLELTWSLV